jgi:hypothetical protein
MDNASRRRQIARGTSPWRLAESSWESQMQDDNAEQRRELLRITQEVAGRLSARGIHLRGNETPDEITAIADAVERFEDAVESHGGDLMMDEPPPMQRGEPDDPLFLLPSRGPEISATQYVDLLAAAVDRIRGHRGS